MFKQFKYVLNCVKECSISSETVFRSSRLELFFTKEVLKNLTKFTGKHLCQSLFFDKVAGLRPTTLLKKTLWSRCFPVNFAKFLSTPFLEEYLRWLLLRIRINFQSFGNYDLSFKWRKFTNFSFVINGLYVSQ